MAVTLTEKAVLEVKRVMEEQKYDLATTYLRVGASAGGCSGFSYSLGFATEFDPTVDMKYDCGGVGVLVDKKAELYLDGTILDYADGLERRGFHFNNPSAVKTCGCGSSFSA